MSTFGRLNRESGKFAAFSAAEINLASDAPIVEIITVRSTPSSLKPPSTSLSIGRQREILSVEKVFILGGKMAEEKTWKEELKESFDLAAYPFDRKPLYVSWFIWCWHRPIYIGLPLAEVFLALIYVDLICVIGWGLYRWAKR